MSFPRIVLWLGVLVFAVIGAMAFFKKKPPTIEIPTSPIVVLEPVAAPVPVVLAPPAPEPPPVHVATPLEGDDFPEADIIFRLFTTGPSRLPFIETIAYTSTVPWLQGRSAWVADYASYYSTSRHFIARSLNGKPDYFSQKVSVGSRFNVFKKDKKIEFHLLVDITRCKLGLYCLDLDSQERILLKTYLVGLGAVDPHSPSGSLTPLGRYSLGSKIAIYKPGTQGLYRGQNIEMMTVFGTRWIPFDQDLEGCTAAAKGYGLHGVPWTVKNGKWEELRDYIRSYDSDGCIRMLQEDIEEIFAVIITKPSYIWLVKDFHEAQLPGIERSSK